MHKLARLLEDGAQGRKAPEARRARRPARRAARVQLDVWRSPRVECRDVPRAARGQPVEGEKDVARQARRDRHGRAAVGAKTGGSTSTSRSKLPLLPLAPLHDGDLERALALYISRLPTCKLNGVGPTSFARLFTQSIYKWVQTPLSLHVGNLDFRARARAPDPRRAAVGVAEAVARYSRSRSTRLSLRQPVSSVPIASSLPRDVSVTFDGLTPSCSRYIAALDAR